MTTTQQMLGRVAAANAFDKAVKVGDTVQVRWTWGGVAYIAKATVSKVNDKSIRAKLLEEVTYTGFSPLPVGRELKFPRYLRNEFSVNNCFLGKSRWVVSDLRSVYKSQDIEAFSPAEAKVLALPLMFGCPVGDVDAEQVRQARADLIVTFVEDLSSLVVAAQ